MSTSLLRRQYLDDDGAVVAIEALRNELVGHAIAVVRRDDEEFTGNLHELCQLISKGKVMWIAQLVVHHDHRGQGHASILPRFLITSCNPIVVGVASSHPHGILALKKASMSLFDEDSSSKLI